MGIVVPDIACLREPNLLVPGKKPVGAVRIDRNHPLAPDVLILGNKQIDDRHDTPLKENGSIYTYVDSHRDLYGFYTGSTANLSEYGFSVPIPSSGNDNPYNKNLSGGGCFVFRLKIFSSGTGPYSLYKEGATYNGFRFIYRTDLNTFSVATSVTKAYQEDIFYYDFGASGLEDTERFINLVFDYDGVSWRLYVNGDIKYTIATPSHGTLSAGSAGPVFSGSYNSYNGNNYPPYHTIPTFPFGGIIQSMGRYTKSLSAQQIRELHSDPYQFLIPA